jgi:hypothetical protein
MSSKLWQPGQLSIHVATFEWDTFNGGHHGHVRLSTECSDDQRRDRGRLHGYQHFGH